MRPLSDATRTREWYRFFADEAESSPTYRSWALGVAGDDALLGLLETLPWPRRQPNLVFGAARFLGAPASGFADLRAWLLERWPDVAAVAAERRTQTNEAGRCAVLLPALSRLDGPIALIEVGASAGLCLYPDRYAYEYRWPGGVRTVGESPVVLRCTTEQDPGPLTLPRVVSRSGVDLNPLDVTDPDDLAWLTALVWPEHDERRARLLAAAQVAAEDPPRLTTGDLLEEVTALVAEVPPDVRPVVLHSAVLAYLGAEDRLAFVDVVQAIGRTRPLTWLSNEGPAVLDLPGAPQDVPAGHFLLARDGTPLAVTGQHGESYLPLPSGVGREVRSPR